MEQPTSAIPPSHLTFDEAGWSAYYNTATLRNLSYLANDAYPVDSRQFDLPAMAKAGFEVLLVSEGPRASWGLFEHRGGIMFVSLGHMSAGLYSAHTSMDGAREIIRLARTVIKRHKRPVDESKVDVRFWTTGPTGPRQTIRTIAVPSFDEIADNYAPDARRVLDHMMSPAFEPGAGGQLALWHGPPGTGKTYALRALSREWRSWCQIDYVVDPEQFFGDATYLMPVMMADTDRPLSEEDDEPPERDPRERWRLLIFEDTGELLSADARARAGQGLSRLLNIVDGFVGQGLRTLILITTNEELDKLHPAVSRPGRCAVKAHFGPLPGPQAKAWGKRNGVLVPTGEHSLAELFALRDGSFNDESTASRPIGFIPRNEEAS